MRRGHEHRGRIARAVAVTSATVAAAVALAASPASAAEWGIHGAGNPLDDWWDEQIVSAKEQHHPRGNVAAMWQQILWADGYLTWADIDGDFGTKTTAASKKWQADHGLDADGLIGRNTWKKASTSNLTLGSEANTFVYWGTGGRKITFKRPNDPDYWQMQLGSEWGTLSYDLCTYDKCVGV